MVEHRRKSHQRSAAVALCVSKLAALQIPREPPAKPDQENPFDGKPALDPAAGDLNVGRAERKRQQIQSAAAHAVQLLNPGDVCVEFGAGSGHLGLLVASLRPDVNVILVELKRYTCDIALARIEGLGLKNASVFCGSVDEFDSSEQPFDCAIGLHLCGLLTDSTLDLAMARRAAVCLVPCCYGQLVGGTNHDRGGGTMPCMHPRSAAYRAALGDAESAAAFQVVARAADLAMVGKDGVVDVASEAFVLAHECMRLVDTDRCLWMMECFTTAGQHSGGGDGSGDGSGGEGGASGDNGARGDGGKRGSKVPRVSLARLDPPTCSPKASIILVRMCSPAAAADSASDSAAADISAADPAAAADPDAGPSAPSAQPAAALAKAPLKPVRISLVGVTGTMANKCHKCTVDTVVVVEPAHQTIALLAINKLRLKVKEKDRIVLSLKRAGMGHAAGTILPKEADLSLWLQNDAVVMVDVSAAVGSSSSAVGGSAVGNTSTMDGRETSGEEQEDDEPMADAIS